MAAVKFNKTALKAQRDALKKYQTFLPILVLKKMQLQLVIRQMEPAITAKTEELRHTAGKLEQWAEFLDDPIVDYSDLTHIDRVETLMDNVAGVSTPEFQAVYFKEAAYSLFATPPWLEDVVEVLKQLVQAREELKVLLEKERLLKEELRTTSQRVNLFEKRLIPELKENIRRIKIFLGDQETASTGWAKMAKAKILAREGNQA